MGKSFSRKIEEIADFCEGLEKNGKLQDVINTIGEKGSEKYEKTISGWAKECSETKSDTFSFFMNKISEAANKEEKIRE